MIFRRENSTSNSVISELIKAREGIRYSAKSHRDYKFDLGQISVFFINIK